jgi:hypothetical protein
MMGYGSVSEDTMRTMSALASTALLLGSVALVAVPAQAAPKAKAAKSKSPTSAQTAQPQAAQQQARSAKTRKSRAGHGAKAAARKQAAQRRPVAQGDDGDDDTDGYIIRGQDAVGMVAMLPWWRSNDAMTILYLHKAVASPVLTAAGRWRRAEESIIRTLADSEATSEEAAAAVWAEVGASARSATTAFAFADPRQVFDAEIVVKAPPPPTERIAAATAAIKAMDDSAEPAPSPPPTEKTWLQSVFGFISSAFSALF